jgi:general L-amino acid transport system substrate-binding protein
MRKIMFKIIKQLTSVVAMFAVLFAFSTETMAAKKSKTLENTKKRGFVRCGVSRVYLDFQMLMNLEIGQE